MADDTQTAADRRHLKPRDAATLVIVDRTGPPRVLLGRRRPTQIFLPDKFVFPGGRADRSDRQVPSAGDLPCEETRKLLLDMKGGAANEARARGLAMAAVRESYEEAGILIGRERSSADTAPGLSAKADVSPLPEDWSGFFEQQVEPDLSPLRFLARAITPPGRPRRYDTRFFFVDARAIARTIEPPDDELRDLDWFTIEELRRLDLPNITRAVVEDLNEFLDADPNIQADWPVPFYFFKAGAFERQLLR